MKVNRVLALMAGLVVFGASVADGLATYVGYSGAPGSRGSCASSCHGSGVGTIAVSGFPGLYDPGASYLIHVTHSGGSQIVNFNASVRTSPGDAVTGTVAAGFNTSTYTHSLEASGIHFESSDQDSGTFTWTAPSPGVGAVRLYLAGLQMNMDGPNTELVINAAQNPNGIEEGTPGQATTPTLNLDNRVVTDYLLLSLNVPASTPAQLRILNYSGRTIARLSVPRSGGAQTVVWKPVDNRGRRIAPGSYFVSLVTGNRRVIRKFTVVD